jgi:hypothetical protein
MLGAIDSDIGCELADEGTYTAHQPGKEVTIDLPFAARC